MPWLLNGDRVLASVEVAETARARVRGLLGRDGIEGALVLRPAKSVHTLGLRFPIDVAYCDRDLIVRDIACMRPNRIGRPRMGAHAVVEAEAGAFARWGLQVGDRLELREPAVP